MGFRDTLKKWDEENKKAGEIDLPEVSEIFPTAQAEAPSVTAPVAPLLKPTTDYKTDIATSPQHAAQLRVEAAKQKEADAAAVPALLYGGARGLSLGSVDRLAGLGTLIGEHLGSSDQTMPPRPGAYQEGRAEYLAPEDKARKLSPGMHFLGEMVGGAPVAVAAPQSLAGRLAFSGGLGAASGALNTREDDAKQMATNAAIGGALGIAAEGTIGTIARKAIRNAPKREMDATVRDVMESEAGRATTTTGKKLARDIDDVRDMLKSNPDARAAVRKEAKDALPVIEKKASDAAIGQSQRYELVDQTIKPMTVTQLLGKIVEAEKDVPENRLPLVKKALKSLRDSLRDDFAPKWGGTPTWSGQKLEIPTERLRAWVSSVQGTAEAAMGGINGTNAAKVPQDVAKIANKILEERLDQAAAKGGKLVADAVSQIRESDRQVAAWLSIKRALDDRGMKELAQNAGLSTRLGHANSQNANAMGLAIAAEGHPVAGATIAAKGMLAKGTHAAGRYINDAVLSPVQDLAERGAAINRLRDAAMDPKATLALIARMAAETGVPQGIARAVFEQTRPRPAVSIPVPAPTQNAVAAPPTSPVPFWPRDYATSTRTR